MNLKSDTSWMVYGRCRGADPNKWFPERGDQIGPAIAECNACPVKHQCLNYALDNGINHGIWGGVSERGRRRIKRARRLAAAEPVA